MDCKVTSPNSVGQPLHPTKLHRHIPDCCVVHIAETIAQTYPPLFCANVDCMDMPPTVLRKRAAKKDYTHTHPP